MSLSRFDARVLKAHAEDEAQYADFAARRKKGESVAYILGEKEFWSLSFDVGPGVLVPRPDTETLVEEALKTFPDAPVRAADFGVGSGAMLLSFLSERAQARGVGIDSSQAALDYAIGNARKLGLDRRTDFVLGDWSSVDGMFDLIFSNPPYLTAAELAASDLHDEPAAALDGGADGFDAYRALAPAIAAHLNKNGFAFVEIGLGQGDAVRTIFAGSGLEIVRIAPDLSGIPRCVVAQAAKSPWKGAAETLGCSRGTGTPPESL
ncbi:MAG TPA: peptide chain release factor N(5)-glutamine methyltransferase [Rhizomicrobium sp.]